VRQRIYINGIVQGVGFRPFVYRLARSLGLLGFVRNSAAGVVIEAQGEAAKLRDFIRRLGSEAPALAQIESLEAEECIEHREEAFTIIVSDREGDAMTHISPDSAVCKDCLRDLEDPSGRYFNYPFVNCTNCGPRFTIIKRLPYDRPFTSMAGFDMCPDCAAEYNDPQNRRFHAQPVACTKCGPQLWLADCKGKRIESDNAVTECARLLKKGSIVAVKGIGGFHLAADARNDIALRNLRRRKRRASRPFALMLPDLETAKKLCRISAAESKALLSAQRPIVLLRRRDLSGFSAISGLVAPGQKYLGAMLPYAPLHHLLMKHFPALVMTSANLSDEPIVIDNDDALQRLGAVADYFLFHDRDILQRCDDSIVAESNGEVRLLRRARGYVPAPLALPGRCSQSILAAGAEQKCTIAVNKGRSVYLSQHIGDLDNPQALGFFNETINHLCSIFEVKPALIVHDLHPHYLSTQWAQKQNAPKMSVQHHHAHLAAVLAENEFESPALGLILDGTGYGTDGTIWGGEVLVGNALNFKRVAWQEPVPMPGGEASIHEPWRMALSWLNDLPGCEELPVFKTLSIYRRNLIREMISKKINSPLTSSCGRLFDAVSAMLDICAVAEYEAQPAIMLEMAADDAFEETYNIKVNTEEGAFDVRPLLKLLLEDHLRGRDVAETSALFHNTLASMYAQIALTVARQWGLEHVALSGGVFQNRLFTKRLQKRLTESGLKVLTHKKVPCNDGGIAFG